MDSIRIGCALVLAFVSTASFAAGAPVPVRASFYSIGKSRWLVIQNISHAPVTIAKIESKAPAIPERDLPPELAKAFDERAQESVSWYVNNVSLRKSPKILQDELVALSHEAASAVDASQLMTVFSSNVKIQNWGELLVLPLPPCAAADTPEEFLATISAPIAARLAFGVPKNLPAHKPTSRDEAAAGKLAQWVLKHPLVTRESAALKASKEHLERITNEFIPIKAEFDAQYKKIIDKQGSISLAAC